MITDSKLQEIAESLAWETRIPVKICNDIVSSLPSRVPTLIDCCWSNPLKAIVITIPNDGSTVIVTPPNGVLLDITFYSAGPSMDKALITAESIERDVYALLHPSWLGCKFYELMRRINKWAEISSDNQTKDKMVILYVVHDLCGR